VNLQDNPDTRHPTFYWGWVTLMLGLVIGGISVFWVSPPETTQTATALPWEAKVNEAGALEVLGLILDKSTTRDAMALYGKEVQVYLFADGQGKPKSLESFFEDMYIGYTMRGKLVLNIGATREQLQQMMDRGIRIKALESGAREVSLDSDDTIAALDIPIHALTYIPYPKLDEAALESRFGKPVTESVGDDKLKRWHYPDKKLIIIFDDSGRKALQFGE
jgi:hypothetical protein